MTTTFATEDDNIMAGLAWIGPARSRTMAHDYDDMTAEDRRACFDRWVSTQLLYEAAQRAGLQLSRDLDVRLVQLTKEMYGLEESPLAGSRLLHVEPPLVDER